MRAHKGRALPARVTVADRIRGGLRGFLAAMDSAMDPDAPGEARETIRNRL